MVVRLVAKLISLLFLLFSVAACDQGKTSDSVFSSDSCLGTQFVKTRFIVDWEDGRRSVEVGENREQFLKDFVEPNLEKIKNVEYDQVLQIQPFDSSKLNSQFSFVHTMSTSIDNWGITRINAPAMWQAGHRGEDIIISIVDTGVDVNHPSLTNRIAYNTADIPDNGIDDDGNGYVDDYSGYDFLNKRGLTGDNGFHGTHVAGIAAAEHEDVVHNTGYVQGVAPAAKILPAAFMNGNGGSLSDALLAIEYSESRGAKIINASWGGAPCSKSLGSKISALSSNDILFVTAAGNSSINIDLFTEYPASYNLPAQITVGSISSFNGMAAHSNYGDRAVHLFAPGEEIFSTVPNGGVAPLTGTSMATPFVAGAAALLWSANPGATAEEIKAMVYDRTIFNSLYRNLTKGRLSL